MLFNKFFFTVCLTHTFQLFSINSLNCIDQKLLNQENQSDEFTDLKKIIQSIPKTDFSSIFLSKNYKNLPSQNHELSLIIGGKNIEKEFDQKLEIITKTNNNTDDYYGRLLLPPVSEKYCLTNKYKTTLKIMLVSKSSPNSTKFKSFISNSFRIRLRAYSKLIKDYFILTSYQGKYCNLTKSGLNILDDKTFILPDLSQVASFYKLCKYKQSSKYVIKSDDALFELEPAFRRVRLDILFLSLLILDVEMLHRNNRDYEQVITSKIYGNLIRSFKLAGVNRLASLRKTKNPSLFEFIDIIRSELFFVSDFLMSEWNFDGIVQSISQSIQAVRDSLPQMEANHDSLDGLLASIQDIVNDESSLNAPVPRLDKWADKIDKILLSETKKVNMFSVEED